MAKQTSIEWLESEFIKLEATQGVYGVMYELLDKAKKMHKEEMQERMYSEEDMREAFLAGEKRNQWSFSCPSFKEWFEQFKKKSYDQTTDNTTDPNSMG